MAGIFDSIGNMFSSYFHPERGYEEAQKQLENYFNQASAAQQPYINQGQQQFGNLMGAENALMNPTSLLNQWIQSYQTSPYAQQLMQNAQASGLNSASSQGLLGSSAALNNIQNTSSQIMNADRQQYLNDLMQKYLAGVGIGKDIYNTGSNQASNFGNLANNFGQNIAQASFNATNAPGALLDQLIKLGVNTGTSLYTGGQLGNLGGAINNLAKSGALSSIAA